MEKSQHREVNLSLQPARITWAEGIPYSLDFGDYYYSRKDPIGERSLVFLEESNLALRFREMKPGETFVIGELGFGVGLSFLLTWQLWQQARPAGTSLVYQSCELSPLTSPDLKRAQLLFPELSTLAAQLQQQYAPLNPGWSLLSFPMENLELRLWFGDGHIGISDYALTNAWYLDGFAPRRNECLWNEGLAAKVAAHSQCSATFSTFAATSMIARTFSAAGFRVYRKPGFRGKRERMSGVFAPDSANRSTDI